MVNDRPAVLAIGADSEIASGVNLTFATHFAANLSGECQIQNSTRNLIVASGPLILTFARTPYGNGMQMLELDH